MKKRFDWWGIADKGATLVELIVVISVLAIISTIVVSFVMMSNENVQNSRKKVDALNDIAVVESYVDAWVEKQVLSGSDITPIESGLESNGNKLIIESDDKNFVIKFDDKSYTFSTITDITFEVKDDNFVICTVSYKVSKNNTEKYVFTVYPYIYIDDIVNDQGA